MMDLTRMRSESEISRKHLVEALKRKVKWEASERDYLLPCTKVTSNVLNIRLWVNLMATVHEGVGQRGGPDVSDWEGSFATSSKLDGVPYSHLITFLK